MNESRNLALLEEGFESGPVSKRLFDLLLSSVGVAVSAPLWAVIALMIKLEDAGPFPFFIPRSGWESGTRGLKS